MCAVYRSYYVWKSSDGVKSLFNLGLLWICQRKLDVGREREIIASKPASMTISPQSLAEMCWLPETPGWTAPGGVWYGLSVSCSLLQQRSQLIT